MNRVNPMVTVMIPTYNQAKVLERAVRSAQGQTYSNLEILVSDDNSSDNTSELMKSFANDPRVRYVRHPRNLGRVGNYREMIYILARGEWLLNVDGDDYLSDPEFIEKAMQVAQSDPQMVLVFGRQKYFEAATQQEIFHPAPQLPERMSGLELFLKYPSVPEGMPHIGSLYRKDVAIKAGVQQEDIITSDSESLLRIIVHGSVGYIDRIAGCWVEHSSNESGKLNFEKRWSSLRMALGPAEYLQSLGTVPPEQIEEWREEMLARLIRENLALYLDRQDCSGYLNFFKKSNASFPQSLRKAVLSKGHLIRLFIPGFSKLRTRLKKALRT